MKTVRLDKWVADALGVTRSAAREIIKKGRVCEGGKPLRDCAAHVAKDGALVIDGASTVSNALVYLMLNKPAGVVSATEDKRHTCVLDLLAEQYKRYQLFPVGRLDIDTEGFLLLTNDGQLAHDLLSPKKKIGKTYAVQLESPLSEADRLRLEGGIDIGGYVTKPCTVRLLAPTQIEIVLAEGKFHQIKRMLEAVSNRVVHLERLAYGDLYLDTSLERGQYRPLTPNELNIIQE